MRWALFVLLTVAVMGCGPSAADLQVELSILERMENELKDAKTDQKEKLDKVNEMIEFARDHNKWEDSDKMRKNAFKLAVAFDTSNAELEKRIAAQKEKVDVMRGKRSD